MTVYQWIHKSCDLHCTPADNINTRPENCFLDEKKSPQKNLIKTGFIINRKGMCILRIYSTTVFSL
jgi:hypothetical protein